MVKACTMKLRYLSLSNLTHSSCIFEMITIYGIVADSSEKSRMNCTLQTTSNTIYVTLCMKNDWTCVHAFSSF